MQPKSLVGVKTFVQPQSENIPKRKQVGILGGNFNPVHTTHLIIADQVGRTLGLEKVFLMPEYLPPHVDEKETIPAEHRLKMLELAIEDNPLLAVETIELARKGKSYTYDTMKELTEKNPDTDYYFIIGGDMVAYLPKWYRIDELTNLVNFVGVRRPNFSTETAYPIIWVDVPLMDISSSLIRKKIAQGCSAKYLLPDNVLNYIQEEGLYLDEI
ncbi:nicotinate-nucleotide adenylyltransferase [Enterococcus mediterraneensis]|uniref:nicotinate-nucleotide adenylyltransferase n=1 Tax=Enterococcus mediterraneensis TaxID=2364791 RepID=UPI000F0691F3|nr:nicotinate-nucleotide adenylyltransferase [Enterococcus mediterraneensis]